ncbi:MAG: hypothetical protein KGL39_14620 [Patescibacteria group bacterium]|nr:hypothetical protein [Patescibacteria group bacterium]
MTDRKLERGDVLVGAPQFLAPVPGTVAITTELTIGRADAPGHALLTVAVGFPITVGEYLGALAATLIATSQRAGVDPAAIFERPSPTDLH